jgi:hypothetical protein
LGVGIELLHGASSASITCTTWQCCGLMVHALLLLLLA